MIVFVGVVSYVSASGYAFDPGDTPCMFIYHMDLSNRSSLQCFLQMPHAHAVTLVSDATMACTPSGVVW